MAINNNKKYRFVLTMDGNIKEERYSEMIYNNIKG